MIYLTNKYAIVVLRVFALPNMILNITGRATVNDHLQIIVLYEMDWDK